MSEFKEHDSFNLNCWCNPYLIEDGSVIVHNDEGGLPANALVFSTEGGRKDDSEKPRMDLLDHKALVGVSEVLGFGARKYAAHNWRRGISYSRLIGAAYRHLGALNSGEDIDPESGLPHVDHLGCCIMFLSNLMKTRPDLDDRYKEKKDA